MNLIDSYRRSDGCECVLENEDDHWRVTMWDENYECRWQLDGVTHGGTSDGFRTVGGHWVPYDEATARAEFERWRT